MDTFMMGLTDEPIWEVKQMGSSDPANQKPILEFISQYLCKRDVDKVSVLDMGLGSGNFGSLLKNVFYQIDISLDGVEIWDKYKNPQWDLYNNIFLQHILSFLAENKKKYDIVLLIDIIEHFNKEDGEKIIQMAKNISNCIIVSTPISDYWARLYWWKW